MRVIPTLVHGAADYLVGLIVVGLPFYFGWTGSQRVYFIMLGTFVILYSVFTDYEVGLIRVLRLRFHLMLDVIFCLAMLCAPRLLALPGASRMLVYTIGALALLLVVATKERAQGTYSPATIRNRP